MRSLILSLSLSLSLVVRCDDIRDVLLNLINNVTLHIIIVVDLFLVGTRR